MVARKTPLQIRILINTNLQQSSLILPNHRFFKHVGIAKDSTEKSSSHTFSFASKDLDAINLENILHQNSVKAKIPYFKYQSVPIIWCTYITPTVTKIINYKHMLQDLNIHDFQSKHLHWTCTISTFIYNLTGHVICGDLNIENTTSLYEMC